MTRLVDATGAHPKVGNWTLRVTLEDELTVNLN